MARSEAVNGVEVMAVARVAVARVDAARVAVRVAARAVEAM